MKVVFRTDATSQIGTGHFMRCLTLAEGLKKCGAHICFVSRDLPAYLQEMLAERGLEYAALPHETSCSEVDNLSHSSWLGTSQKQDAYSTAQMLLGRLWDWLVVDHYALDARWETTMRGLAKRILVIDDIADRQHDCDVLLDQNFYADMQTRYTGKVPEHCQLLLGPRYALLRESFGALHKQIKPRAGVVKRILIFFGGMDADNYTSLAISALAGLAIEGLHVDVVIGAQHPNRAGIEGLCASLGYVCHVQTNRMAELMAAADLAIGAGGSATWERCCLGLPALLVSLAENQTGIARSLDEIGACIYMGTKETVDVTIIQRAITQVLHIDGKLKLLSASARSLVDGWGVNRVCQRLSC